MGHISHRSIVITGQLDNIELLVPRLTELGVPFIGPSEVQTNGYVTLCVVSSGSKSGWDNAVTHEQKCRQLFDELGRFTTDFEWVCVAYGWDDQCLPRVVDSFYGSDPRPSMDAEDLRVARNKGSIYG